MLAARREGQTLQQIGERWGVSRERVRQILGQAGALEGRQARERQALQATLQHAGEIERLWQGGSSQRQIVLELGLPGRQVEQVLGGLPARRAARSPARSRNTSSRPRRRRRVRLSDERLLARLRDVAVKARVRPTVWWWNAHHTPPVSVYRERFGGWLRAQALAGVPAAIAAGRYGLPDYRKEDAQVACERIAGQLGRWPTNTQYEQHHQADEPPLWLIQARWSSTQALKPRAARP